MAVQTYGSHSVDCAGVKSTQNLLVHCSFDIMGIFKNMNMMTK